MDTEFNNEQQETVEQVMYPQQNAPTFKHIGIAVAVFIAIALGLGGAYILYTNYVTDHQTCTVGLSGVATNITFTGAHVDDLCKSIEDEPPSGDMRAYPLDQPQGDILCAGDYTYARYGTQFHYIIRDTNLMTGNTACTSFIKGMSK